MENQSRFRAALVLAAAAFLLAGCSGASNPDQTLMLPGAPTDRSPEATSPTSDGSPSGEDPKPSSTSGQTDRAGTVLLLRDQEHLIADAQDPLTVRCDDGGDVEVDANGATVRISGSCQDVKVSGSDNTVAIEFTEELDVRGSGNEIRAEELAELKVKGQRNTVRVDVISIIRVDGGKDNILSYNSGDPYIDDRGSGNDISSG